MSLSIRIKSLEAAVKRLETAAGMGQKCAYCRFVLRESLPNPKGPKRQSAHSIKVKCQFCNTEYKVRYDENMNEDEREVLRLKCTFTMEDEFTNPRAHAFRLWYQHLPEKKKKKKAPTHPRVRNKTKLIPHERLIAKWQDEIRKLVDRKRKSLEAKYGAVPFPEHLELVRSVHERERKKREPGSYVNGLFDLEMKESNLSVCAELEKIIWGETKPSTTAALEKIGQEIEELIRTSREAAEKSKEEARLRNLAFLNNNRASVGLPPLPEDYGKK